MNQIKTTITKITTLEQLNLVEFEFQESILKMVSLDLNEKTVVGQKVILGIKSTNINLAKDFKGELSFSNQIVATIKSIEEGDILSSIILEKQNQLFETIITKESLQRMSLKIDDEVIMLIKSSDLAIVEFIND